MLIRPVHPDDLDDLFELAKSSTVGIPSLPPDPHRLEEKIERSIKAFSPDVSQPKGESYLFVLESNGKVVGCSGIVSKTHSYVYEIKKETLHLRHMQNGPSEVCTLLLHPDHRGAGAGSLLSLSRFLFIGAFPERFDPYIWASFRGIPPVFWDAVCKPFFHMEFDEANSGRYIDPSFIETHMPKHPISIPSLPKEVQEVIGKIHPNSEPAYHILKTQGFSFQNLVDIFDAGPFLNAKIADLAIIRRQKTATIQTISGEPKLVSNKQLDFRATLGTTEILNINPGDPISYVD